jgi:hypothetical protein
MWDLSMVCTSLIKADLESKLRATLISSKEILLEPDITEFFVELHEIEESLNQAPFRLSTPKFSSTQIKSKKDNYPEEIRTERTKLARIRGEIFTYIYFTSTLVDFFGRDIETIKDAENAGSINELARAHQLLSVNPAISRTIIAEFRKRYNIMPIQ